VTAFRVCLTTSWLFRREHKIISSITSPPASTGQLQRHKAMTVAITSRPNRPHGTQNRAGINSRAKVTVEEINSPGDMM
jgi:hypothetical protein